MDAQFKTVTHAKCILAGEHAVSNNYYLVAKSIPFFQLTLSYFPNPHSLHLETGKHCSLSNENLLMYFYALLRKALGAIDKDISEITGTFSIETNIPIAAGLGFSSAICLALTEWMIWKEWITPQSKYNYARKLEDMFHGKSSGADIAASMSNEIIIFKKPSSITALNAAWKPHIYITTTHRTSITADAVQKVQQFRQQQPELATLTDIKMEQSALLIIDALRTQSDMSMRCIICAFNKAKECFQVWGLIPPEVDNQMQKLMDDGALAVKPTGAGNGGSILSLWENAPPAAVLSKLIPVF